MLITMESVGTLFTSKVDATRRYAIWALDGIERIGKLHFDTMATVYAETGKALQASLPRSSSHALMSRWETPLEVGTQRTVDFARAYAEAATHWLEAFKRILEEQEVALNSHLVESVEEFVEIAGVREARTAAAERRREPAHVERKSQKLAA
jgi:hypothetical protein